jgi:hypothetical protein
MMKNIQDLRNQQREDRNPGHELGTFLLRHSNSLEYLIEQLEGYLEAAKLDQAAERAFHGGMMQVVKAKAEYESFLDRIAKGQYDGAQGFNQFRHDVPAQYGQGDLLDELLNNYGHLGERDRLKASLKDLVEAL